MKAYDTFTPAHYRPDGVLMTSIKEHREVNGMIPTFRLLRQVVKLKMAGTIKTVWPK